MSFGARLHQARLRPADSESIADLARDALGEGKEEQALPLVVAAAETLRDARLWQWAGLLNRALDEHLAALECFTAAARRAPGDAKIAQGHAQVAFEAGLDSVALFERARVLAPQDPSVILGLNAARVAAGQVRTAIAELEAVLRSAPLWIDGHLQLAQLRILAGEPSLVPNSLEYAIARHPGNGALWDGLCGLHLRRAAYRELLDTVRRAEAAGVPAAVRGFYQAIAAGELGEPDADNRLSDRAVAANPHLALWRIRHLLRRGRPAEALPAIDRELRSERGQAVWPYAAVAWRTTGDSRSAWLEDQVGTVSVIDLSADLGPLASLADQLRALHSHAGEFMDQSVRGGTQTDGPLLSRIDPEIRKLRAAITAAVEGYTAKLPPPDPDHPLLGPRRDLRIRFSGSWSVRLSGGGKHSNHVHPLGWISSALYVALPERHEEEAADAGWLVLGEPQTELGVDIEPHIKIEPKPGRLVLFPSWMWHGTRAFAEGERLTVAFDVAPPR